MKLKITTQQRFYLNLCFNDVGGNQVVAYEVNHWWRLLRPDGLPDARPQLRGDETILRMESNFLYSDVSWEMMGFTARFGAGGKKIRLGDGKKAARFPITGSGSGGNQCWETVFFPNRRVPHVFNWLRRQTYGGKKLFGPAEWDEDFYENLWQARSALTREKLSAHGQKLVRLYLQWLAAKAGSDMAALLQSGVEGLTVSQPLGVPLLAV